MSGILFPHSSIVMIHVYIFLDITRIWSGLINDPSKFAANSCIEILFLVFLDCLILGIFLIQLVCCCDKLFKLLGDLFPKLVCLLAHALHHVKATVMKTFARKTFTHNKRLWAIH
jgi:hypothetical protein